MNFQRREVFWDNFLTFVQGVYIEPGEQQPRSLTAFLHVTPESLEQRDTRHAAGHRAGKVEIYQETLGTRDATKPWSGAGTLHVNVYFYRAYTDQVPA